MAIFFLYTAKTPISVAFSSNNTFKNTRWMVRREVCVRVGVKGFLVNTIIAFAFCICVISYTKG